MTMMERRLLPTIVVCCFLTVEAAAIERDTRDRAPEKAVWDWTAEERLAARRHAAHASDGEADMVDSSRLARPDAGFAIDGRRNPELFLSHELMAFLLGMKTASTAETTRNRAHHESAIRELGWEPTEFWRHLDAASTTYDDILRSAANEPSTEESRSLCNARFDVLTAMRAKYRRFDEFLYLAIAPRGVLSSHAAPAEEWSLWLERGCR
ncbi:MAG TPA: hypothetical protein VF883_16140 [Thermoanaerobaculia bacterium]